MKEQDGLVLNVMALSVSIKDIVIVAMKNKFPENRHMSEGRNPLFQLGK